MYQTELEISVVFCTLLTQTEHPDDTICTSGTSETNVGSELAPVALDVSTSS